MLVSQDAENQVDFEKFVLKNKVDELLNTYKKRLSALPTNGAGVYTRLISAMAIQRDCEKCFYQNTNPEEYIIEFFNKHLLSLNALNDWINTFINDLTKKSLTENDDFTAQDDLHIYLFNETWKTLKMKGDSANDYNPWLEVIESRLKKNNLDEEFFNGKKCIDVGCGTGRFSLCMARNGGEVYAIDPGAASLKHAKQISDMLNINNIQFYQQNAYSLDFEEGFFDFATCNGVLHHLDNPIAALKEIYRVLKPGGKFWLYIEGSGGIYHDLWDALYSAFENVPISQTFSALKNMDIPNIHFWMDKFYAKYNLISWDDNIKRIKDIGFQDIVRMKGTSITDLDIYMFENDPYLKIKFGDGNMRMLITKKKK
jgi:ubiquinone/menaquinone biosynthesis C-methylase UbiE